MTRYFKHRGIEDSGYSRFVHVEGARYRFTGSKRQVNDEHEDLVASDAYPEIVEVGEDGNPVENEEQEEQEHDDEDNNEKEDFDAESYVDRNASEVKDDLDEDRDLLQMHQLESLLEAEKQDRDRKTVKAAINSLMDGDEEE